MCYVQEKTNKKQIRFIQMSQAKLKQSLLYTSVTNFNPVQRWFVPLQCVRSSAEVTGELTPTRTE